MKKSALFVGALARFRNIGILLIALGVARIISGMWPYAELTAHLAAFGVYLLSVIQSLASKKFHEEYSHKQKIKRIQDLNYKCLKLAAQARKHTNAAYNQKLTRVIDDKNAIVNSFFTGEKSFLKEKIVEQTLNLVVCYIRLLTNFCIRCRELSKIDVSEVIERINKNMRKLNFVQDANAAEDLKKLIEMDEKIVNRLKEEKAELERISTKLDYIESTVNMFKHQIMTSIETEEMLETLETAVNEATALDNVLEERRRTRINA